MGGRQINEESVGKQEVRGQCMCCNFSWWWNVVLLKRVDVNELIKWKGKRETRVFIRIDRRAPSLAAKYDWGTSFRVCFACVYSEQVA